MNGGNWQIRVSAASGQHFFPSQQLMAAATNSLQKNLEDILQRNGSGRQANRTSNHDSQQGGDNQEARHEESKMMEGTAGTPIYVKEQTVNNDDKLYDVMILIKPKKSNNVTQRD